MGKSRRGHIEYNKEQKLIHENNGLKKELSRLRKLLARVDVEKYDNYREILEQQEEKESNFSKEKELENLKKSWGCRECDEGYMQIIKYTKGTELWYFRNCNLCKHRTRGKRYNSDVKGILKND